MGQDRDYPVHPSPAIRLRDGQLLPGKVLIDVAPSIEDVDDLDPLILVAEEDDITLVRHGTDVGPQFRPMGAKDARQSGQMLAPRHQLGDKALPNANIPTLARDVTQDVSQVISGRCQIDETPHSVAVSDQFLTNGLEMRQHVIGVMRAALRD